MHGARAGATVGGVIDTANEKFGPDFERVVETSRVWVNGEEAALEVAQFYQRKLQQHPGDWQVRYRLAWLAFARGRLEQAVVVFSRILRGKSGEMPDWVRAGSLLYLARVHDLRGEREQAVKLYEEIVDDYEDLSAHQSARLGLVTPYRRVKLDAR